MRTRVLLLGGQTIALGLMMAFLVVPASALFLNQFGADALAYVYLTVAVAGVAISAALSRAQHRVSLASSAAAVVWIYLGLVAAAWLVLTAWEGVWVTFPLLVLFPLSIPIGFALVGAQAGRLLDVRQMKAHFPRVAAGFSVGFAIGGVGGALLVDPLGGPTQLLAVDLVAAVAMLALVVATGRRFSAELRAAPEPMHATDATKSAPDRRELLRNRVVVVIFGYQILSAAVTQLLDFMVWERAAARYPDPSDLARFQGVFAAIINVTSVVFVVALAGWILTRFGIGVGLAANPVAVLLLLGVTSVIGGAAGPASFVFFALVCASQVTDITLTDGTTRTSINAAYQSLLPRQRLHAQTMIEGAGVPIALGLVGALLIVRNALDLDVRLVGVFTLFATIVWTAAAVLAYRAYGAGLREVLTRRAWDPMTLRVDDELSRGALESLMASGDLRDTATALEALADAGSPQVATHLTSVLASADPAWRRLAAEVAGSAGLAARAEIAPALKSLLDDADPEVRLAAAAALVGGDEEARSSWVSATHDDVSLPVALAAAAAAPDPFFVPRLLGLAGSPTAPAELVDALVAHADQLGPVLELQATKLPPLVRERVVSALGEAGSPRGRTLLVDHLADGDPALADAAARSLAGAGHRLAPGARELEQAVSAHAAHAHRCLQILSALDDGARTEPVRAALRDELDLVGRRVRVLLSLGHDPRAVAAGIEGLRADTERDRNTALEMLEVTVGRSNAQLLRAIASDALDDAIKLQLLSPPFASESRTPAEWLRELVVDEDSWPDPWLRACALYAVPDLLAAEAQERAAPFTEHPDPVVAETARSVAGRP